jgi:hypothetical protein
MSSTFTAPIRVNTRQTTSNDGTISPDNTGAAVLSQQKTVTTAQNVAIYLPAGSFIHSAQFIATDTGTSRAITLDGVSIGSVATTGTINQAVFTSALVANTGPATSLLAVGGGGTDSSAGVFSVVYTARNADGTITPYGSGYTNN